MSVKPSVSVVASLLFVAVCGAGATAGLGACQLQGVCLASREWYDGNLAATTSSDGHAAIPSGAGQVDENRWQSGPIESTWFDFPGQRTNFFFPNGVGNPAGTGPFQGPYFNVDVSVSPNADANGLGSNMTTGSGNIAEWTIHEPDTRPGGDQDWFIAVTNASCAEYYVRVTVERATPSSDAGAPLDAGPLDAAPEASLGNDDAGD